MSTASAVVVADRANRKIGAAQLELLLAILDVERDDAWLDDGARDLAHWVSMRYGVSHWKACRWVGAARSFEAMPALGFALREGVLSIDKVVELARFATPDTIDGLTRWAEDVSAGAIRRRGDVEIRRERDEALDVERTRTLEWGYFDDGRRFGMEVELPAADGAAVIDAIERLARSLPEMPDEEGPAFAGVRRADALVALCTGTSGADAPARSTVVVHARLDGLTAGTHGCEIEDGPAVHPMVVERLLCTASVQTVVEDDRGNVVQLGERSRLAPAWMERQVRYRDRGCTFPGCGTRRFTEAHHIRWWRDGGRTTLENLALICSFHHRLVHEHGWRLERLPDGDLLWRRPNGTGIGAGPVARAPDQTERIA
jgi:hypothetical protein